MHEMAVKQKLITDQVDLNLKKATDKLINYFRTPVARARFTYRRKRNGR